jgi:cytoskeletal protein RodZ
MVESRAPLRPELLGIGERLHNAREAKGLSLRAVADLTRIRAIYLQALEEERFDLLPGAVYARGFLRTYADALGLDADRLLDAYPGALEPPPPAPIGTAAEIPIQPAAPRSRLRIIATYVAVVLGAGLLAIGVIGYLQLRQFNEPVPPEAAAPPGGLGTEAPTAQPAPPATVPAPPPAAPAPSQGAGADPGAKPAQPPVAAPEAPPPPQPEPPQPAVIDGVALEVRTQGTSWLRVTADGTRVFQGLMHEGEARSWQGRRRLTIRVGNAPAVQVAVNGRRVHAPPGKRVWEQTFTKP